MTRGLFVLLVLLWAAAAGAQTHPCDNPYPTPTTYMCIEGPALSVTASTMSEFSFCHDLKNEAGEPIAVDRFRLTLNDITIFDGPLSPVGGPNAAGYSLFIGTLPAPLTLTTGDTCHTVRAYASAGSVESAASAPTLYVMETTEALPPSQPAADISVSHIAPAPSIVVTVSFSVSNPTPRDWISLAPAGSGPGAYLDWAYTSSCTQTPGTARVSGSCPFLAPATVGAYEFRLLPNDQFTILDMVTVTVTEPAPSPSPPPPLTDTTAPVVSASGVRSGNSSNVTITASASDAVGVVLMEVYVNGTLRSSTSSGSQTTVSVKSNTALTFTVRAKDAAGNVGEQSGTVRGR
jgi:hypothetical protein